MREYVAKMTSKGQLTLPAAVRRELGLDPGDRITIVVNNQQAELRRLEHNVMSVFGMIPSPPGLVTEDFDDLIEEAMSTHADTVVQRMREGLE
ncbi:MAG: AbrB/MazE/SpoVT family DNA-binding domain-containing protein [Chloroflexota bacterium]|nr:AbrB/MazE/SpoVT family DNA-binding domain-containing protein [Chloroflexota bacterium]